MELADKIETARVKRKIPVQFCSGFVEKEAFHAAKKIFKQAGFKDIFRSTMHPSEAIFMEHPLFLTVLHNQEHFRLNFIKSDHRILPDYPNPRSKTFELSWHGTFLDTRTRHADYSFIVEGSYLRVPNRRSSSRSRSCSELDSGEESDVDYDLTSLAHSVFGVGGPSLVKSPRYQWSLYEINVYFKEID